METLSFEVLRLGESTTRRFVNVEESRVEIRCAGSTVKERGFIVWRLANLESLEVKS